MFFAHNLMQRKLVDVRRKLARDFGGSAKFRRQLAMSGQQNAPKGPAALHQIKSFVEIF